MTGEMGSSGAAGRGVELSAIERRVIDFLAEACGEEEACGFDPICRDTGYDRKAVQAACRRLAALGLAVFQRGLMTEDGELAGSGYGCTHAGLRYYWNARPAPSSDPAQVEGEG